MAFFKFRLPGQRAASEAPGHAAPTESVEVLRQRAKHRLIGAAVLVGIGVVGFPLLFDTQPRPIAVDIPIEIPDRNKAAPLALPASRNAVAAKPAAKPEPVVQAEPEAKPEKVEKKPVAGERVSAAASLGDREQVVSADSEPKPAPVRVKPEVVAPKKEAEKPKPAEKTAARPEKAEKPVAKASEKPTDKPTARADRPAPAKVTDDSIPREVGKPAAEPKTTTARNDDGAKARALLEGGAVPEPAEAAPAKASAKPAAAAPAAADGDRYVVQIGSFAEQTKAREARLKVEAAGLKTYTQVADTKDGRRIRVRVGPFDSRAAADKAAAKIKSLSLSAAVLTL